MFIYYIQHISKFEIQIIKMWFKFLLCKTKKTANQFAEISPTYITNQTKAYILLHKELNIIM